MSEDGAIPSSNRRRAVALGVLTCSNEGTEIELLRDQIVAHFPSVQIRYEPPQMKGVHHFLEVASVGKRLHVEWKEGERFYISDCVDTNNGPDPDGKSDWIRDTQQMAFNLIQTVLTT